MSELKLVLSPAALNVLFPEGSEARAELSRAVIQKSWNSYIKGTVNAEMKDAARDMLSSFLGSVDMQKLIQDGLIAQGFNPKVNDRTKEKLRLEAEAIAAKVVRDETLSTMRTAFEEAAAKYNSVEYILGVADEWVKANVRESIKKEMREKLDL